MTVPVVRLQVAKCPAYVWRVHSWGRGETHNWIDCWYVINAERHIIDGGYYSGSNIKSGYAHISRKKEAVAFVEGFHWAQDNLTQLSRAGNSDIKGINNPYAYARATHKTYDAEMEHMFESGAIRAYEELVERKKYAASVLDSKATVLAKHYTVSPEKLATAGAVY